MLVKGNEIIELIPQRPPVVLVEKLIFADEIRSVSAFTVESSCIFEEDGFLSESGLLENIAQTAAVGLGYVYKKENKPVPIGYIASIKNFIVHGLPPVDSEIRTEVDRTNQVMDVSILTGKVFLNGRLLAECEMRIFLKS